MAFIYGLTSPSGDVFYVGGTSDLKRRRREHRKRFGYWPDITMLEETGPDWRPAEHRWLEHFRVLGQPLINRTEAGGGYQTHGQNARELISQFHRGKPKSAAHREAMSRGRKGMTYDWTEEGVARAITRFAPGHDVHAQLSDEARERKRIASKANAKALSSEERARRNRIGWANLTDEQRAARGRAISEGQRRWRENFQPRNSELKKAYWASKTPEERKAWSQRALEARRAKRAASKHD